METNFTPLRILVFVLLLVGLLVFSQYFMVHVPRGSYLAWYRVNRAWTYYNALFIAAAYISCFTEFQYGLFPPTSLRPLIIAGGIALMALALALMYSLQHEVALSHATPNQTMKLTATATCFGGAFFPVSFLSPQIGLCPSGRSLSSSR